MKFYNKGQEQEVPVRKKDAKIKFWKIVSEFNDKIYLDYYNKISVDLEKSQLMTIHKLEGSGGRCDKCSKEWIKIEKENRYHYIIFYKPSCYCYFKCPLCGRSLHLEQVTGTLQAGKLYSIEKVKKDKDSGKLTRIMEPCPYACFCGHNLLDVKNRVKYHGKMYEKENFDFLNNRRKSNHIYYEMPNGELVIERKDK